MVFFYLLRLRRADPLCDSLIYLLSASFVTEHLLCAPLYKCFYTIQKMRIIELRTNVCIGITSASSRPLLTMLYKLYTVTCNMPQDRFKSLPIFAEMEHVWRYPQKLHPHLKIKLLPLNVAVVGISKWPFKPLIETFVGDLAPKNVRTRRKW